MTAYPEAHRSGLGRCLGYPVPRAALAGLHHARLAGWWREDLVDEVLGAVVADRYGEQSE
ncbi:hypothetical protein [Methylobrevis pamukkalensis]|uniref:Uncharacterized protein n=1 Tax=Methylobrevis pamukkalensis TaxID=1439726 RepID=A0A1E3H4E7_9HYPH|nr:hypothetical protein [Methylobrevis pamukkalensis]ODN71198.1 hypothetical protein A6302_01487 [Methylobrevis pamukkalensis]